MVVMVGNWVWQAGVGWGRHAGRVVVVWRTGGRRQVVVEENCKRQNEKGTGSSRQARRAGSAWCRGSENPTPRRGQFTQKCKKKKKNVTRKSISYRKFLNNQPTNQRSNHYLMSCHVPE